MNTLNYFVKKTYLLRIVNQCCNFIHIEFNGYLNNLVHPSSLSVIALLPFYLLRIDRLFSLGYWGCVGRIAFSFLPPSSDTELFLTWNISTSIQFYHWINMDLSLQDKARTIFSYWSVQSSKKYGLSGNIWKLKYFKLFSVRYWKQ